MAKKIVLVIIVLLIIIQFFPAAKNTGATLADHSISAVVQVPEDVNDILKRSCNDCHSNSTYYPWYSHLQPVGWWLANHIEEGKHHLNFSEFATYTKKRQDKTLKETGEQVEKDEMPLSSYTLIHTDARLSKEQKEKLLAWSKQARKEVNYTPAPGEQEERH